MEIDPTTITPENNALATAAILMKVTEIGIDIRDLREEVSADINELRAEFNRECVRRDEDIANLRDEVRHIGKEVDSHRQVIELIRFSSCEIVPWIRRNKNKLVIAMVIISAYLSLLDWINRWLQWSFLPPGV